MDWRTKLKTLNDWVEKAILMKKSGATVGGIIEFIDWQNHTRYSDKEVGDVLEALSKSGRGYGKKGKWFLKV